MKRLALAWLLFVALCVVGAYAYWVAVDPRNALLCLATVVVLPVAIFATIGALVKVLDG